MTALYRLDENSGNIARALADDLQAFRRAVVEDENIGNAFAGNAWRNRHRTMCTDSLYQDFIEAAVVVAGEHHDKIAPGYGARQAHRSHHGF
jgi:hypothetical protein